MRRIAEAAWTIAGIVLVGSLVLCAPLRCTLYVGAVGALRILRGET